MYDAVHFIGNEINTELRRYYSDSNERALVSRLVEPDGSVSPKVINKIVISLVNVEQISVHGRSPVSVAMTDTSAIVHSSPLHLNLFLLVTASFTDYAEALKNLSICAAFFQSRKEITRDSYATLPDSIEKLDMQLEDMTLNELNNLWGMMGGKHHPSLYYKLRIITLDRARLIREVSGISNPSVEVGS